MTQENTQYFAGHHLAKNLKVFWNATDAVDHLTGIYNKNTTIIREAFASLGEESTSAPDLSTATYPYVGITVHNENLNIDGRVAFGAVLESGVYGTTVTRPDLFRFYFINQLDLLITHHKVPVVVGESLRPIPLPFVDEWDHSAFTHEEIWASQIEFALPNLQEVDDSIPNGTFQPAPNAPMPLSLFSAERVDFSLNRLHHYCGTETKDFQKFVLLTNYQRYIDAFIEYAHKQLKSGTEYTALVEPGGHTTFNQNISPQDPVGQHAEHLPQMPAYHLKRADGRGITFINIGVGPSNAKTITDHLAVLRPHCWIMLGHCAGLRRSQRLGDYVLAHAYIREDHVLDQDLPTWIPIPTVAEVQVALERGIQNITGQQGQGIKARVRTGTVVTTDNRNWELRSRELMERFRQSRAIALDMESATVAANGFRMRVPYATLLCVSDKPIHGELKLRGTANSFYRERVKQHLEVGLETIRILQTEQGKGDLALHSRKLRSFDEPPFR